MIIVSDPKKSFVNRVTQSVSTNGLVHSERLGELERTLRDHDGEVDVVVLGPNHPTPEVLDSVSRLEEVAGRIGIVLVTPDVSPPVLQAALRAGLRDVIAFPLEGDQLHEAIERAREHTEHFRDHGAVPEREDGSGRRVITVFSTKGGCGKSMVATNLAVLLAEETGEEVVLLDFDLQSGDLAIMLQLLPAWTVHDAAENLDRLDAEALRGYLTEHKAGFKLLAAPVDPSQADAVGPRAIHRIVDLARDEFPYVIIDTPPLFTDEVLAALDESDECVLITSMDVPSIKNLKLALQTLAKLGLGRDRVHLALNRADSDVGLRIQDVEKSIGTTVDVSLPSSRDVPLSVNRGVPIALARKRSPIVAALSELVERVRIPAAAEESPEGRRGFLRRS